MSGSWLSSWLAFPKGKGCRAEGGVPGKEGNNPGATPELAPGPSCGGGGGAGKGGDLLASGGSCAAALLPPLHGGPVVGRALLPPESAGVEGGGGGGGGGGDRLWGWGWGLPGCLPRSLPPSLRPASPPTGLLCRGGGGLPVWLPGSLSPCLRAASPLVGRLLPSRAGGGGGAGLVGAGRATPPLAAPPLWGWGGVERGIRGGGGIHLHVAVEGSGTDDGCHGHEAA